MKLSLSELKINRKGFTLIELLVVIAIISLLSSVVLAVLKDARQKSQNTKTVAEVRQLQNALELYKTDNGKYPNEDEYFQIFYPDWWGTLDPQEHLKSILSPKYIPSIPNSRTIHPDYSEEFAVYTTGNGWGLYYDTPDDPNKWYIACGDKKLRSYIYYFYNDQELDLPLVGYYSYLEGEEQILYPFEPLIIGEDSTNWYCIGE